MGNYPKTVKIKDGSKVILRHITKEDGPALLAFFRGLSEEDRQFLKEDVTKESVIRRWIETLNHDRVLPLIAEKDSEIIADATLHFNRYGWFKHMAEIRCVVAKKYQKSGLGTMMMKELLSHAQDKGIDKIVAELMDTQTDSQKAFQRIGFIKEGELRDFVCDIHGKKHNLVVMVNDVSELWKKMEDLLLDYDIKTQW